jgi:hypothetical protein
MPSDDLRFELRRRLSAAVRDRDRIAVAALREAIAALDNAEAVRSDPDLKTGSGPYVAGGVVGLGAAEVERRILDAGEQRAILRAVIETSLTAASTYDEHGQSLRATELRSGAEILIATLG